MQAGEVNSYALHNNTC